MIDRTNKRNATLVASILIFKEILKKTKISLFNPFFPVEKYIYFEQCRSKIILHVLSSLIVIKTVEKGQ